MNHTISSLKNIPQLKTWLLLNLLYNTDITTGASSKILIWQMQMKKHILPCKLFMNVVFMTDDYPIRKKKKTYLLVSTHTAKRWLAAKQTSSCKAEW